MSSWDNFIPEDGCAWQKWELSAPLFENFYIIGPDSFHGNGKPVTLYEYPPTGEPSGIESFLFLDGLKYANLRLTEMTDIQEHIQRPNPNMEEILSIKQEAGMSTFTYCLRFRASPWTRPALLDDKYEDDIKFYKEIQLYPTCLFAFCFVSSHPFHSLLFGILRQLINYETQARLHSENFCFLLHDLQQSHSGMQWIWPRCVYESRESVLEALYQQRLPSYGNSFAMAVDNENHFVWKMPQLSDIPLHLGIWGKSPLLDWIELGDFVRLLKAIFLESYVIVVGTRIDYVVKTVSLLPQLIQPFSWTLPVITLLPPERIEMFGSPMMMIVGIFSKYKKAIPEGKVVVDLDTKKVIIPDEIAAMSMPNEESLVNDLKPVWMTRKIHKLDETLVQSVFRLVREFMTHTFVAPMEKAMSTKIENGCVIGTQLNLTLFNYNFRDPKELEFVSKLRETVLFGAFKEQKAKEKTDAWKIDEDALLMTMGRLGLEMQKQSSFVFDDC